jgi:hypothetical protein
MDSDQALFSEHYAAAQSLKSPWTRMASTYGCIMVVLSRKMLTITPHWFAKWALSLLALDLNHEIPINNVKSVTKKEKCFGYGKIELHFVTIHGVNQKILLYLKKYQEFVDKTERECRKMH